MSEEQKNKLLDKIDIVALVSEYVQLSSKGSGYVGLSPFKKENTPSFIVSPQKKIFKDFSSGIGGNAIYFYMKINNLSYNEALYELSKKYNVEIQGITRTDDKYRVYYDILEKSNKYYENNLKKSEIALKYLKEIRKYSDEDIKNFKLGFADDSWDGLIKYLSKDYTLEEISKLGLISSKNDRYYDVFRNRIMFPIYDIKGRIVGFGGRDITDDPNSAKYINSKETKVFKKSNEIYGLFDRGDLIKKFDNCILVEGFFDVLALHKNNIKTAIASLGTSLTENQVRLISKLTKNVVIAYDDDEAGLQAKIRAIYLLNKQGFNIKIMSLEKKSKDPDEFLKKFGKEEFVKQYNKAVDPIDFLYNYYSQNMNLNSLAAKRKIINLLKEYFGSLKSSIIFDFALANLANKLGFDKSVVSNELNISLSKKAKNESVYIKQNNVEDDNKDEQLEKQTISLIQKNIKKYHNEFRHFKFSNLIYGSIYNKMAFKDYSTTSLDDEERIALLDADTCIGNLENEENTYVILFRLWVIKYMNESIENIIYLKGGINKFEKYEYAKLISQKHNLKKIKNSMNINDIQKIFNEYIDYERKGLV